MSQRDVSEVHRYGDTKPSANASAAVGEPKIATFSGDRETPAIVVTSRERYNERYALTKRQRMYINRQIGEQNGRKIKPTHPALCRSRKNTQEPPESKHRFGRCKLVLKRAKRLSLGVV